MSERSFFMIYVNTLDVSIIITNAVLLHLRKIKSKFMHLWECLLVLKMMTIEVKYGRLDFRLVKEVASYAAYDSWRLVTNWRETNLGVWK